MKGSFPLGRVAGVPLAAHWSVLVALVVFAGGLAEAALPAAAKGQSTTSYWVAGTIVAIFFFGSLLGHELAHALVARHYGLRAESITLWMLGGVTSLPDEPKTPRSDLLVAVAGPGASLVIGVLFGGVAAVIDVTAGAGLALASAAWLAGVNVLLAVFNLLPGAPLDGGRVVRALLWRRWHDRSRAAIAAAEAGRSLGIVLTTIGLLLVLFTGNLTVGLWYALLGWFLMAAARAESVSTRQRDLLGDLRVGDVMTRDPVCLPAYQAVHAVLARVREDDQEAYPVVDFDGRLVGLVTVAHLLQWATLPEDHRLADMVARQPPVPTAAPGERVADVLVRAGPAGAVVVVESGVVVGLLTPRIVERVLRDAAIRRRLVEAGSRSG